MSVRIPFFRYRFQIEYRLVSILKLVQIDFAKLIGGILIADGKGLEMDELLTEMEKIVNSGTKLNIDYYIDEVIDEDCQDDIYEYFREAATDSLEDALKELGEDDYTEEEIRLMRIKFICNEAY